EPATSTEAAGNTPSSVAVGDFDGNGNQDLAVTNQSTGKVTILLGDGTGNFTVPASSPESVGSQPTSVAVGDFGGDGNEDLAVTNSSGNTVTILLGDGTGDFSEPATSPEVVAGLQAFAVAVGDFDEDGDDDLAVANQGSENASILLNRAPPPPVPPPPPAVPPPPPPDTTAPSITIAVADGKLRLNKRGKPGELNLNPRGKGILVLTCSAEEASPPCTGKVKLTTAKKVATKGGKKKVTLAKFSFSLGAGVKKRFRVQLSKPILKLVEDEPSARDADIGATVSDAAGNRAKVAASVTLTPA
ncbi:MAG: VCBS repeat-containing protein, partial [Solirubrobacterales bacterium]